MLVKGGAYLEEIGRIKALAFDKTGTLTMGHPEITKIYPGQGASESDLLSLAASVEYHSEHPLARAIVRKAVENDLPLRPAQDFTALTGLGARARVEDATILIGSPRLLQQKNIDLTVWQEQLTTLVAGGNTVILVARDNIVMGCIALSDKVRSSAAATVAKLQSLGISPVTMLTGDNPQTAAVIAKQTGVDSFQSSLLPQEKVVAVQALRNEYSSVGMVGDGINDAPAWQPPTWVLPWVVPVAILPWKLPIWY
ncbi:hypothetical protein N752_12805 [Desulforamulus aquiferis]|nr:hypothetical protein N752_12805 [Desulforamulus aquiferis]